MSYRLNPYKILRFIVIVAFLSYAAVEFRGYIRKKTENTNTVTKTLEVRKDDFAASEDLKNKLAVETAGRNTVQDAEAKNSSQNTAAVTEEKKEETSQQEMQKTSDQKNSDAVKEQSEKAEAEKNENLEKSNAEAAKKAQEQKRLQQEAAEKKKKEAAAIAAAKAAKENITKKIEAEKNKSSASETGRKRYIQVATFQTEGSAKKAADKLGSGFSVQAVKGSSGKTMYRIISYSTTDPDKLKELEAHVKNNFGGGYLIRTAGK